MRDRLVNTAAGHCTGSLVVIITALLLHCVVGCRTADRATPTTDTAGPAAEPIELVEESWPNGEPRLRRQVLREPDGTLVDHGTYTRWHRNGRKEYEAAYIGGKLHGIETAWHENGQKRTEQFFDHGMRHGVRRNWDQQGHLRGEERYLKDAPHGTWTIWKADGSIKWQARFDRGKPIP